MSKLCERLCYVVILVLLALVFMQGCNSSTASKSSRPTSRETAVQTPDHTGLTWFEPTAKGAK